jgi:hypothetical protein
MSKTALLAGILLGFSMAGAAKGPKTYGVRIPESAMVGTSQLKPGDYRLRVAGSKASFTNENSNTTVETAVNVQNVERKFDKTTIEMTKNSQGDEKLTEIQLGGSRTKLDFPN